MSVVCLPFSNGEEVRLMSQMCLILIQLAQESPIFLCKIYCGDKKTPEINMYFLNDLHHFEIKEDQQRNRHIGEIL